MPPYEAKATKQKINDFIQGTSNSIVFGRLRKTYGEVETEEVIDISLESSALPEKAVYFVRTQNSVELTNENFSDLVSYGELNEHMADSLKNLMHHNMLPFLRGMAVKNWGLCEDNQREEYLHSFRRFNNDLIESIKNSKTEIMLKIEKELLDVLETEDNIKNLLVNSVNMTEVLNDKKNLDGLKQLSKKRNFQTDLKNTMFNWLETMKKVIHEAQDKDEENHEDCGLRNEMDYWKHRYYKLNSIDEQLKTPRNIEVNKMLEFLINLSTMLNQERIEKSVRDALKVISSAKNDFEEKQKEFKELENELNRYLTEAKNNDKYLSQLERYVEQLEQSRPRKVIDQLPLLLYSIRMIYNIDKYYSNKTHIIKLFRKLTNQMITCCKNFIKKETNNLKKFWNFEPVEKLIEVFNECIELNTHYRSSFHDNRADNDMRNNSNFDFTDDDTNWIFSQFDSFKRKLTKLIEVFLIKKQINVLEHYDIDEKNINKLEEIVTSFERGNDDYLKINDSIFDKNYVKFTVDISKEEANIKMYISKSYENMSSIEQKINLLQKFKRIFERPSLKKDLEGYTKKIVDSYQKELMEIKETVTNNNMNNYQIRNMPFYAKNILFLKNLVARATAPIGRLELVNKSDVVKTYNEVCELLVKKQIYIIMEFFTTVENHKSKLQSPVFTSVTRSNGERLIVVNFDPVIFQLIREAKVLERNNVKLLKPAETVLIQEDKYKRYFNELNEVIGEYYKVRSKIRSILTKLMQPHLKDFEYKLKPGFYEITWTSLKIESFIKQIKEDLVELSELIYNSNDLIESRIEKNIKAISQEVLVKFPESEANAIPLEDFVNMQRVKINSKTIDLKSKNVMIEKAVNDLLQMINSNSTEKERESQRTVKEYYNYATYQALLHSTKASLNKMKERLCTNTKNNKQSKPFFEINLEMDEKKEMRFNPLIESVQRAINNAAKEILSCSKKIYNWGQDNLKDEDKEPFYKQIATDKEIVRVILLLTGSIKGTEDSLDESICEFTKFKMYYKPEPEDYVNDFTKKINPKLEEYYLELNKLDLIQKEINNKENSFSIGAICLKNEFIKDCIYKAIQNIKKKLIHNLHEQAKSNLETQYESIKNQLMMIDRESDSTETLVSIMGEIKNVRNKEYEMKLIITPIQEMYLLIDRYKYLDLEYNTTEEDKRKELENNWNDLLKKANSKFDEIRKTESKIKTTLLSNIVELKSKISSFKTDYENNGPKQDGLEPKVAANRLSRFKEEYKLLDRNRQQYNSAQDLLGIPKEPFNDLTEMQKEIDTLEKLYTLYNQVCQQIEIWNQYVFNDLQKEYSYINDMRDSVARFNGEGRKLGKDLKKYDAYTQMANMLENYGGLIDLVEQMVGESTGFGNLHWDEINKTIAPPEHQIDYESGTENIKFKNMYDAELHKYKDETYEIIDKAKNQKKALEKVAKIRNAWDKEYEFSFKPYKDKSIWIFSGVGDIMENMTNDQNEISGLQSKKFMSPFMDQILMLNGMFNNLENTIKKWTKVQSLWTALEPVFSSEDIRKQLPQEASKFKNLDKDFVKNMNMAKDIKNVKLCCENDVIVSRLPDLEKQLYECQRKLDKYLETKKQKFARFYFVSDETLLSILSTGSNPEMIQQYLQNIFDAISGIDFEEGMAVQFYSVMGRVYEKLKMVESLGPKEQIELWLLELEDIMKQTVKKYSGVTAHLVLSDNKMENALDEYLKTPAQCALMGLQMYWTFNSESFIFTRSKMETGSKDRNKLLLEYTTRMDTVKNKLIQKCLTDLDRLQRQKIEAMITIDVHLMEIFKGIVKELGKIEDFNWQKQNRVYWLEDYDNCIISITDVDFVYSYEYLGAKERLAVTGLTDKCYITLAQALGMYYGGAPAGPAGTGKTESVKDMGRTLGIFVVVTNCTPQQGYDDMAKIFKGLSISGIWGCFDEFNRIKLEVLSVVATQVQCIKQSKQRGEREIVFPDKEMSLISFNPVVGYFITMNPGYAGRQELPENLKVQFRGVCMMVPDRKEIMKTFLATSGYTQMEDLAVKFNIVYRQCEEQLSKQRHYDFGLRNIKSVLRQAGNILREEMEKYQAKGEIPKLNVIEEQLMYKALKDMNLSKLVKDDVKLFESLLDDVFVYFKKENDPNKLISTNVESILKEYSLIFYPNKGMNPDPWFTKILQLYDTNCVRHSIMLVGPTGSGKSTIIQSLTSALTRVSETTRKNDKEIWKIERLNPRSITQDQLYGERDVGSGDFFPGVFSTIWKEVNTKKPKSVQTWMVCDGPVDAIWVEDLNTVMDDNKILTLANNERIPMSDNVKLIFENESLKNASPATVSRAGIVYVSHTDLGWKRYIEKEKLDRGTKIGKKGGNDYVEGFYKKYFDTNSIIAFMENNKMFGAVETNEYCKIKNFIDLYNCMLELYKCEQVESDNAQLAEKIFLYCLMWGICGTMDTEQRKKISTNYFSAKENNFPVAKIKDNLTVFDYYMNWQNEKERNWEKYEVEKVPLSGGDIKYSSLLIPNVDSAKVNYILNIMLNPSKDYRVLICGDSGTAKTSNILLFTKYSQYASQYLLKRINFSFATTPALLQESIQEELEMKGSFLTPKKNEFHQLFFIDDLSMPELNKWGDQVTLELMRQAVEDQGFYIFKRGEEPKMGKINKTHYVSAMTNPGGGKNDIPNRLKRHYFIVNMLPPESLTVQNIFGFMQSHKFPESLMKDDKGAMENIAQLCLGTIDIWKIVKEKFIPTPQKFTYNFTMKDLSKIMLGIFRIDNQKLKGSKTLYGLLTKDVIVHLWRNECTRVISDRFIDENDLEKFKILINEVTSKYFKEFQDSEEKVIFTEFLQEDAEDEISGEVILAPFIYEPCVGFKALKAKTYSALERFNADPKNKVMDLVLFEYALEHINRIARLSMTRRSSSMMIGVGGSGKQSCTHLACYMGRHYQCKQVVLVKNYGRKQFLEDFKEVWVNSAKANVDNVTFLLTDNDIKKEEFLEFINSFMNTGEVSNMLEKPDKDSAIAEAEKTMVTRGGEPPAPEVLWEGALNKVMDSLHIVLAFSPMNPKFRERGIQFPSLFTSCSINYFFPWPEEALIDTAEYLLGKQEIYVEDPNMKQKLYSYMAKIHKTVIEVSQEYFSAMRRNVYCTPKSYLSFIDMYMDLYQEKFSIINIEEANVIKGLDTISAASKQIDELKKTINKQKEIVEELMAGIKEKAALIKEDTEKAKRKAEEVEKDAKAIELNKTNVEREKKIAEEKLADSKPILEEALSALSKIQAKELDELAKYQADKVGLPVKYCFDCVAMLLSYPVKQIEVCEIEPKRGGTKYTFYKDSYDITQKSLLKNAVKLLEKMKEFGAEDKRDKLNDEAVELCEAYLQQEWFNFDLLFSLNKPSSNVINWIECMKKFRGTYKMISPLIQQVNEMTDLLNKEMVKLEGKQKELDEVTQLVASKQADLDKIQAEADLKRETLEEFERKLYAAQNLIGSLEMNKIRWEKERANSNKKKIRLVVDVGIGCAFVAYCGPFNSIFRNKLVDQYFKKMALQMGIPMPEELDLINFLVTNDKIGSWLLQGLPNDELSKQNGIIIEKSKRFPLIIDPQNQARTWLERMYKSKAEEATKWITDLSDRNLRMYMTDAINSGFPFILENVENEIDPFLDPILDKSYVIKNRKKVIKIGEDDFEWSDEFKLFCTSRLTNPSWSPELYAKTVVIDFTVTMKGLEEQLLAVVINKEKAELEETLNNLMNEINQNQRKLKELDEQLLNNLANCDKDRILEDKELVETLSKVRNESKRVETAIQNSEVKQEQIKKERREYEEVAKLGSILYFVIIDLSNTNWMYNTSLKQFMELFLKSIDSSKVERRKGDDEEEEEIDTSQRVQQICDALLEISYKYTMRGLFERDKLTFKIILCLKYLLTYEKITAGDIGFYLKATSGQIIDENQFKKPDINDNDWKMIVQLSEYKFGKNQNQRFNGLAQKMSESPKDIERFYKSEIPEDLKNPDFPTDIRTIFESESDPELRSFYLTVFIRCFRPDRNNLCCKELVKAVLCKRTNIYIDPIKIQIEDIYRDTTKYKPVLFLLSKGADPTSSVEGLANTLKLSKKPEIISMGEGQQVKAQAAITNGKNDGRWVILNNSHLSLQYVASMEQEFKVPDDPEMDMIHKDFRLWMTCDPTNEFPLGVLQMCIKVTDEPPKGMKDGLYKVYTTVVNQDRLEKILQNEKSIAFRRLIQVLCYLHCAVIERRKFGPIGFCVPYEFNSSDLDVALLYCEKHILSNDKPNYNTLKYMVCDVIYGGKITDNFDNILFDTYTQVYVCHNTNSKGPKQGIFVNYPEDEKISDDKDKIYLDERTVNYETRGDKTVFKDGYFKVLKDKNLKELKCLHDWIFGELKGIDNPSAFYMNPLSDISCRIIEVETLIDTIINVQPKEGGGGGGVSKESVVEGMVSEFKRKYDSIGFDLDEVEKRLLRFGCMFNEGSDKSGSNNGLTYPMNVFVKFEIHRFQNIVDIMKTTLENIRSAIKGEIIMTADLSEAINAIFNNRIPYTWLYNAAGEEISWMCASIMSWYKQYEDRFTELDHYKNNGHTNESKYRMECMFNPQGFINSVKQEIVRMYTPTNAKDVFKIGNMFMITWPSDESSRRRKKDEEYQESFKYVKLSGLTLEGAVWNDKFQLEDHPEKMVQSEGFYLKITFYSADLIKYINGGKGYENFTFEKKFWKPPNDKEGMLGYDGAEINNKLKMLLDENSKEGDKRILVPIYKYKKRTDKYFISSVYLDCNFQVCEESTIATPRDVGKLRGCAVFASFD